MDNSISDKITVDDSSASFGGIVSELSGSSFWNGAAQAGIIAGFNHVEHLMGPGAGQKLLWGLGGKKEQI